MLKTYYSDILSELEEHISKRKELIKQNCIKISLNNSVDSIDLSSFETEVATIEDVGFQNHKLAENPLETITMREVHDFVKSFKRLQYFYGLERSFFYAESENEYNRMDNILDFQKATLEGKLS